MLAGGSCQRARSGLPEFGAERAQAQSRMRLPATLFAVNDPLTELSVRLEEAAQQLRAPELEVDSALALIEECARLAGEASSEVDQRMRAALEPLPDLPGQLPLPAA
jgi:hypothetical protein